VPGCSAAGRAPAERHDDDRADETPEGRSIETIIPPFKLMDVKEALAEIG